MISIYDTLNHLLTDYVYDVLTDEISCLVTEQRNGCFDLTLEYPLCGFNADKIAPNHIVMASPRPGASQEPFFVSEIDTTIESVLTCKAHHLVYLLDGISGTMSVTGITAAVSRLNTLAGSDYLFINDGITDTTTVIKTDGLTSLWAMVGKCAEAFGAEMEYHYNSSTHKVEVTFHAARGTAKSTVIKTGVNIVALERTQTSNAFSAVRAWWWDGTNSSSVVSATVSTGISAVSRELLLDCKQVFPTTPTTADLQAVAQAYIDANGLTNGVSDELTVDYVPLDITTEGAYSPRLDLCDTATVDASLIGVSAQAECIEVIYNVLTDKYDSVKVGVMQKTVVDTIAGISTSPSAVSTSWKPSTGAVTIVEPTSSSLTNASWVTKANVTLPAGTYMIEYGCAFSANNTGIRRCCLSSTQNSDAAYVRGAGDSKNAVQGTLTYTSGTAIITLSTQRTLYLNARQNSGSSLTVYPWIRAIRIL